MPAATHAGVLDWFFPRSEAAGVDASTNLQTLDLPSPATNPNPATATGGGDVIIEDAAVVPQDGPSGTLADIVKPHNTAISIHTVRDGEDLSSIAKMYDISVNTILWANDLTSKSVIKPGDTLTILPVAGVRYTVKRGDTLASIAKRYGASEGDIASFNGVDNVTLAVGAAIIIPNGEVAAPASTSKPKVAVSIKASVTTGSSKGYYRAPLAHYTRTQGIHGLNGVDLAAPLGTSIMASAAGTVTVAKEGGWNGGYGSYVVIKHGNGSQTLYAHMSNVSTYVGATVSKGETIGAVGNSGQVSGPTGYHLHFEIRNGDIKNPF